MDTRPSLHRCTRAKPTLPLTMTLKVHLSLLLIAAFLASSEAFRPLYRLGVISTTNLAISTSESFPSTITDNLKHKLLATSVVFLTSPLVGILTSTAAVNTANAEDSPGVGKASVQEEKAVLGPAPNDFGLKYDYYTDCSLVVNHMRYATLMDKGDPKLVEVASKTKTEMNEFVSYYRRSAGVNGKQSFSLLYTSINVLAGHYTSYGVKFPVPEKRRKRLLQEYIDIEKNIRKRR